MRDKITRGTHIEYIVTISFHIEVSICISAVVHAAYVCVAFPNVSHRRGLPAWLWLHVRSIICVWSSAHCKHIRRINNWLFMAAWGDGVGRSIIALADWWHDNTRIWKVHCLKTWNNNECTESYRKSTRCLWRNVCLMPLYRTVLTCYTE